MFDRYLRSAIDPPLNFIGIFLARKGMMADHVTLFGLVFALILAVMIAFGLSGWVTLVPFVFNRLCDGLDGAVARACGKTEFGSYLDICCDFAMFSAVPFAFVWHDVVKNGTAGAFLLMAFYINAASYLGFAIMASQRNITTSARGAKSYYAAAGLMEGGETVVFFVLMLMLPLYFASLAFVFGGLCLLSALWRILQAKQVFPPLNEFK
ncbi:MAG: phosphatidylglycerophosphate synthase [Paracoccaceae bacterium]|jgi:phosphatidylglycerophosphate synthase